MNPFACISVIFLGQLALLQLTRFLLGWVVVVSGLVVPLWASALTAVIAAVSAGALAVVKGREPSRGDVRMTSRYSRG